MENLILETKKVRQNNQEFLLGVFKISDVLSFTRYTEYTILGFDEEKDNVPITNNEVQRKLNSSKVEAIADFLIHDPLAIFPTNLVVAIPDHVIDELVESDNNSVQVHINNKVRDEIKKIDANQKGDIYLSIIDGQHRIKGIEVAIQRTKTIIQEIENNGNDSQNKELSKQKLILENLQNCELAVSFFVDPVLEYQAMIFSTINRTQTKVSPDLVYSLFGLEKGDSPQKTSLNIVNTLNGRDGSPFYKRIRLAGSNSKEAKEFYKDGNPVLSQATMVKSILFLISKNLRDADVERHNSREYFLKNGNIELPFRKYYGQNHDEKILRVIYAYFTAVRKVFLKEDGSSYWDFAEGDKRKPTNILQTRVGYEALLMILKRILNDIQEDNNDKIETYVKYLSKASKLDIKDENEPKNYPFANKTKNKFYNDLGKEIWGDKFSEKP